VNQKKSKFERYCLVSSTIVAVMTLEEARLLNVEGINYAAYKETESSLYDSDKNRLFGSSERGFTFGEPLILPVHYHIAP
jgi:hypothetical protein